jgi:hypothetical protein
MSEYKGHEMNNRIWESVRTNSDILTVRYNGLQLHQWSYRATIEIKKAMVHKDVVCKRFERLGLTQPEQFII